MFLLERKIGEIERDVVWLFGLWEGEFNDLVVIDVPAF